MTNKTIGNVLIGSVVIALLTALLEDSLTYATTDVLYTLCGLSFLVFGVWGGIRLRSCAQIENR